MWVSYWNKPGVPKYIHCKWQAGPGLAGAASEKKMLDQVARKQETLITVKKLQTEIIKEPDA